MGRRLRGQEPPRLRDRHQHRRPPGTAHRRRHRGAREGALPRPLQVAGGNAVIDVAEVQGSEPSVRAPEIAAGAYRRSRLAVLGPLALAAALLVLVLGFALTQGAAAIPPGTALALLVQRLPFVHLGVSAPDTWERIVIDVRLPRVLAAALVGGGLAFSGAAYQGVFRNPLAEPYLLGVAAGAAFGAAIAHVLPLPTGSYGFGWVPLCAFGGAAVAVLGAYLVARAGAAVSNATLILAGVAISAIFGSVTSFILLTGGQRAQPVFAFLFGSFNTASWERLLIGAPYVVLGALVVGAHGRILNVLQLDEEQAAQLGVDVTRTKLIVLAAASLVAATAVAIAGVIGFVGLIVPHAVRMLFGGDYRRLLPLTALLGASFLVLADVLSRSLLAPQEVPVGIVTALTGAPFFLYLLRARRVDGLR
ncbi:MAG: iron ABC transporter permease [Dehalococcoidia bacterium]|nr:iron ABC transporter permease [Dehalococcoidia bacterium]